MFSLFKFWCASCISPNKLTYLHWQPPPSVNAAVIILFLFCTILEHLLAGGKIFIFQMVMFFFFFLSCLTQYLLFEVISDCFLSPKDSVSLVWKFCIILNQFLLYGNFMQNRSQPAEWFLRQCHCEFSWMLQSGCVEDFFLIY